MTSLTQYATAAEFDSQAMPSEAFANVDTPTKDRSLQWASRFAAGYVAKRKVLPLLAWGEDLRRCVCELAAYDLSSKRGFAPGSGSNQNIRDRYDDALRWLSDVSRGTAELTDCVDSSIDSTIDQAGPLMSSDPIVNWNYQTRSSTRCDSGSGLF